MKKIVILCLTLFCISAATAQTPTLKLSLEEALDIALDENPTIQIAELELERQKYVRKETLGSLYPSLEASGSYSRAIKKSDMGGGVSFDPDNTVTASASLTIPLFVPGVYKTLRLNDEQMRAAVEEARGNRITLSNEVKKAYYNIMLAEESLDVLFSSQETISQTVEETRSRYEHGLAAEYDLITAEVQLSNLRPTIIQTENSIDNAKKLLKMYMGLPLDINIEVTGELDDFAGLIDHAGNYINEDITYNSDLLSMDIQIDILRRQLEVLRTQRMPTVAAFGSFNVSGRDPLNFGDIIAGGDGTDLGTGSGSVSKDNFLWAYPISAGVQLSVPIFAGNSRVNRERQVKVNIAQMKLQREYLEESISVQLNVAINEIMSAREMMLANAKTVSQAQKGYDISKTRYDAGMGTILELNSAELSLTQAKLNYTQSIYDYLSAQADYEKIKGQE